MMTEEKSKSSLGPKVKPPQKALPAMLKVGLSLVGILGLLYWILPSSLEAKVSQHRSASYADATLGQNVALLTTLQQREKNQPLSAETLGPPVAYPKVKRPAKILSKELQLRMNAPIGFDLGRVPESPKTAPDTILSALAGKDANSAFLRSQGEVSAVSAQQLSHPEATVPAGEMIPATLETAIHSDLAGMTRAITSRDVYALRGGKVLIPKGSILVGQFNASVVAGQRRILVVWNRVQMPQGLIVALNSPSTDSLGRSGQGADSRDGHFLERFGSSALLSILGAYTATAKVRPQDEYNSAAQYRTSLTNGFQQTANQSLEQGLAIAPTLQVNQGTLIQVFVAHDLDFTNSLGESHGSRE